MIKVVGKSGRHVKRVICINCSTELEYTESEVKEHWQSDYGGTKDRVRHIKCPCCKAKVSV